MSTPKIFRYMQHQRVENWEPTLFQISSYYQ